ncbi:MAG: lysophospholipid acyltransferase family protein [Thermoflexales bacterium]|nr:lysophospholipid acyltransferase family protein [Thermoflexales bacterium]
MRAVGDYLRVAPFRLAAALCPRLPPGLGYRLAEWGGELYYRLSQAAARAVRQNARHALGPDANDTLVEGVVRQVFRNLGKNYYDLFRLAAEEAGQLNAQLDRVKWEHFHAALALGRGVVAASAHYGHPEWMMHAIPAAWGTPVLAVAEHLQPEQLYQYMVKLRSRPYLRFIPADGALLEIYRGLRRGEVVAVALDRDTTGSGVDVPFLGANAHMPDGYAKLVARTRAPFVVGFARRLPDGQMHMEIDPPYVPPADASREQVYAQALEIGVQALARAVSAHPDQWVLTTPIWDIDPKGPRLFL